MHMKQNPGPRLSHIQFSIQLNLFLWRKCNSWCWISLIWICLNLSVAHMRHRNTQAVVVVVRVGNLSQYTKARWQAESARNCNGWHFKWKQMMLKSGVQTCGAFVTMCGGDSNLQFPLGIKTAPAFLFCVGVSVLSPQWCVWPCLCIVVLS